MMHLCVTFKKKRNPSKAKSREAFSISVLILPPVGSEESPTSKLTFFILQGEYQLAGDVLQHAQERFPAHGQHSHTWMFAQTHITLNDLLHQGRWTETQTVITNMATSHPTEAKLRCVAFFARYLHFVF